MSERVTMPALGESVTEGTVTRWLKNIGDTVEVDEPLLEVSTDKVDTEIPSPVAGTLQEILVQEDDTVPVGADLAVIGEGAAAGGSGESGGGDEAQSDAAEGDEAEGGEAEVAGRVGTRARAARTGGPVHGAAGRGADVGAGAEPVPELRSAAVERWFGFRRLRRRRAARRCVRRADRHDARARRVGHRGHRHALAEVRGRHGRGRRAAARGLHRQGRHRDPLARRRCPLEDPGPGGRGRPRRW